MRSIVLAVVTFAIFAAPAFSQSSDVVLINGKIITVDAKDSIAQAIAIHDGKIAAVGSNDEIRKLAPKGARVIDLRGLTVTPGLIDSHCHFDETSVLYDITLSEVTSIKDTLELVRKKAATLKPGEWIRGAGWDEAKFAERRYITAADLDAVAPNNPVWLQHTTGHYGVANSYALRLANVSAETKDPEAGIIVRDNSGQPAGVLKETAMNLVTKIVPPYTHEQHRNGLLRMMADFNKEGMTAAKDPGITPEDWKLYKELLNEKKSTVRVFALIRGGRTMDSARAAFAQLETEPKPPQALGDGMLFSGGVKLFMDGSGGGRTAWVYEPWYKDGKYDGNNTGYPNIEPQLYRQMVKVFHDAGYHVSTHAVGDRAIDTVVDTYAALLKEKPTKGLRHGIIHANIPTDHAIETMARLQRDYDAGYPETQPPFLWWIGNLYAASFGPKREARLMPYKTYTQKNIIWAGGSDFFVTPFPARYGLWSSVVRKTSTGTQPFGTAESVDIHTALKSYTIWAAHQLFLENRVGSIEVGKDADLAVWDRDLYSIPSDQLKDIKCQLTLLHGQIVYKATDSPIGVN
ncbi:MAG: amidohydrolase family protein [Acidobacteria bacterium]|nr:amidohydrolase family protein [Acidobacteriota bacterium]MBS1866079.1 amidohydrolase family protein [Acidobacteriota bacterium]